MNGRAALGVISYYGATSRSEPIVDEVLQERSVPADDVILTLRQQLIVPHDPQRVHQPADHGRGQPGTELRILPRQPGLQRRDERRLVQVSQLLADSPGITGPQEREVEGPQVPVLLEDVPDETLAQIVGIPFEQGLVVGHRRQCLEEQGLFRPEVVDGEGCIHAGGGRH